jgi:hypothetical protein
MMEARQAQNITAHNAGDVAITFDAIDVMPHIEIDPVTRRTRRLIQKVSLSEEQIALLQSDSAAPRVFYAEQQDNCIKSLHITCAIGMVPHNSNCIFTVQPALHGKATKAMHEDLVKPGARVDLLAKDGRLVPRIFSFDELEQSRMTRFPGCSSTDRTCCPSWRCLRRSAAMATPAMRLSFVAL